MSEQPRRRRRRPLNVETDDVFIDVQNESNSPIPEQYESRLINCLDCGTKISRRAVSCPRCGAPVSEYMSENNIAVTEQRVCVERNEILIPEGTVYVIDLPWKQYAELFDLCQKIIKKATEIVSYKS